MSALQTAKKALLSPYGFTENDLAHLMGKLMGPSIDGGDIYWQQLISESFSLEEGIVKGGSFHQDQGVGIRAVSGDKTGFAYSDELAIGALETAAKAARCIAGNQQNQIVPIASTLNVPPAYFTEQNPLSALPTEQKVKLLQRIDADVRAQDRRVVDVMVNMAGSHEHILVMDHQGNLSADIRPQVRLNVTVIVEQNGRRETGSCGGGGRTTYDFFLDQDRALSYGREALRQALVNLEAIDAPAGTMPVVLGPGWPGVLLHEAVGHGLEGDFNRKQTSVFTGKLGQQVASPLCTVVDDGTLADRRGSLTIDNEGTPAGRTVLIENGILKGYLQDKMNAKLMNMPVTGNGRRQSYHHLPMPRMTNTFMLAGKHAPDEIIQSVDKGIYAVSFSGGQVDITSGKFVFCASEAYLIEKGKITRPVKGATLVGQGIDVMNKISMVGNDLKLDRGIGTCGKSGQSVPVGVGQPTLKIDGVTVGGTST